MDKRDKPDAELPYLEFHITDHCNLNCKGCTHFSPLAAEKFLEFESFFKDFRRLNRLFSDIAKIRVLGGEPLLHPLVADFIGALRRLFPQSDISIVSNGLLLPSMPASFYAELKKNGIGLDITVYPKTKAEVAEKLTLASSWGIPINLKTVERFSKFLNSKGDSDKNEIFRQCWVRSCTFLREGKIYPCCLPALAHICNKEFGWDIPDDGYIDIHANVTGQDILNFLKRPISACAFCAKAVWFPWEPSAKRKEEWLAPRPVREQRI